MRQKKSLHHIHHLYITQRAMLRNGVQAGEENSA